MHRSPLFCDGFGTLQTDLRQPGVTVQLVQQTLEVSCSPFRQTNMILTVRQGHLEQYLLTGGGHRGVPSRVESEESQLLSPLVSRPKVKGKAIQFKAVYFQLVWWDWHVKSSCSFEYHRYPDQDEKCHSSTTITGISRYRTTGRGGNGGGVWCETTRLVTPLLFAGLFVRAFWV